MWLFYASVIFFYLLVDGFKIYFAHKFKERLKGRTIQIVEKVIGAILILFGIYIVLRNVI